MRYCKTCITPHNRPNISFDERGQCNCAVAKDKDAIDWQRRARDFAEVVAHARSRARSYDCVVPVSGGKDSTWQVVTCLQHGLRPLAVTWRPPGRTALGSENLQNLIELGVDHVDFSINPQVERRFTLKALERFGTPALPMHMALFAIPLTVAVRYDVPLVVWGENSAFEYGGAEESRRGFSLNRQWLEKHGVTHGTTARDWVSEDLTAKDLLPYFAPTDAELEAKGVLAVFLGYYFRWDPVTSLRVAEQNGFKRRQAGAKTGYYDYADIDDDFISIHHWLKWYKFGFTRSFDNLSIEIRNGRLSRDEAIEILRRRGDETPHDDIQKFCQWLGITPQRFFDIVEKFRNREVWVKKDGRWMIEDYLISDWGWI
jgi:N-acetyl sugar amidotransferase